MDPLELRFVVYRHFVVVVDRIHSSRHQ